MREFAKALLENLKLLFLWLTRILLAEDHFRISPWKKISLNLQGYLVDQYVIYDLKHQNKADYLSELDWYKSRRINGDYRYLLNNKVLCADMLKQYARVPRLYAIKKGQRLILDNGKSASYSDILRLLQEVGTCILKPVSAGKGRDVLLFQYENDAFIVNGEGKSEADVERLLRKGQDWFLSEYIQQATYLRQLFPQTANTLRIITLYSEINNEFKIFFAVQRIGTSKTIPVDNGSQGGLIAKVDLDTGCLSEAKSLHNLNCYEIHPDTGNPIKGVAIPRWEEIKREILALANHFPYLEFIAWDILPTENGVCIIEANASSGVNIIQIWGGQKRGELGQFYRSHKVIR